MLLVNLTKIFFLFCFFGVAIIPTITSLLHIRDIRELLVVKLEKQETKIITEVKKEIIRNVKPIATSAFNQYDEHFNCLLKDCFRLYLTNTTKFCREKSEKNEIQILEIPQQKLFYAYCNYDLETNWMLIQRRQDGTESFYRGWEDYKNGFGNLYGEFWLGLERIHQMCKQQPQQLWIRLIDYDGKQTDAFYKNFSIADESEKYKLTIKAYSGDAGDQLAYSDGAKFSTYDDHNGPGKNNCAIQELGGWWYSNYSGSNLNGPYRSYANKRTKPSVSWESEIKYESFRYVHMAIRPAE